MATRLSSARIATITTAAVVVLAARSASAQSTLDSILDSLATGSASFQEDLEALDPSIRDALAPLVVSSVEHLRDDTSGAPRHGIPPDVRNAFAGYVPERLLSKVRWTVDDGGVSLQRAVFLLRDTRALTADHVILFADDEAATNLLLWAHELHHVLQYDAWGVDAFVDRYLDDYESIEHEANEFVWRWLDATRPPK
jgi:hypothetical protein